MHVDNPSTFICAHLVACNQGMGFQQNTSTNVSIPKYVRNEFVKNKFFENHWKHGRHGNK